MKMSKESFWIFVIFFCLIGVAVCQVSVTTKFGVIQGTTFVTTNKNIMHAFYSVPYAQSPPPRFAPSQKLTQLPQNPYNAALTKPDCARWGLDSKTLDTSSSEDCLYLKILTPVTFTCCLPVVFWIQGGGFNDGSYNDYDDEAIGDNFVSKNVIVVQVNHRQNGLGFWTTGTHEALGNYGVWDAFRALEFVYNNIQAFGGDSKRITLMGQESGAVMAELLTMTPLANRMYSGMILIGGTVFDPVIIRNDSVNEDRSKDLAYRVGCDDNVRNLWKKNISLVVDCMKKNVTISQLVSAIGRADIMVNQPGNVLCNYYWRPRHDGLFGILPNSFEHLAQNRPRVPALIGAMSRDWLAELLPFIYEGSNTFPTNFNSTYNTQSFAKQTCNNLLLEELYDDDDYENITQSCIQMYTNLSDYDGSTYYWTHQGGRIATTYHVMSPMRKTATYLYQQRNKNVYLYAMTYDRSKVGSYWQATGSSRYTDIALLANVNPTFQFTTDDFQMMDLLSDLLTNFAKYANPTPVGYTKIETPWLPMGNEFRYMSINYTCAMKSEFYADDYEVWEGIEALKEQLYYIHPNSDMYYWGNYSYYHP